MGDVQERTAHVALDAELLACLQVGCAVGVAVAVEWVDGVEGGAWIVIVLIVEYQSYRRVLVRPPLCGVSESQGVLAVQSAASLVLDETVVGIIVEGEAVGELFLDDGRIDESRHLTLVVGSVVHGDFARESIHGLVTENADAANLGSTTEEGSLRTFGYFHTLQVEKLHGRTTTAGGRYAIHEDGYTWLGIGSTIVGGHATDHIAGVVGTL